MPAAAPALEAVGIAKRFRGRGGAAAPAVVALDGLDLRVGTGEFVAILGPSGCGKSTLFNILAGLTQPDAGSVLIDGRAPERLLGSVGYMPQRDLLMPWRTVLDNCALGLLMAGVRRREARARTREALPRFGLAGFEDRWPGSLSGGMRQRAALVRTFMAGRRVMLLDEPFGALDALTRATMQSWLLEVWQAERTTILFVTHDVDEALLLADRVHVMSGRPGRIALSVDVDLPRPRGLAMTTDPRFTALKARILLPLAQAAREQEELAA